APRRGLHCSNKAAVKAFPSAELVLHYAAFPTTLPLEPAPMSIKSDKWIRRMAEQARMIEPFAPDLVRTNDTGRIVSYGTSSYGYDVRVANEFKIFTNINSPLVGPQEFYARDVID